MARRSESALRGSKAEKPKEVWSFFSGAMGLDLGMESAGLPATLANEIDAGFCKTIRNNRPDLDLIEGSIETLTGESLRKRRRFEGDVHVMVGGPPCQSFSPGGKRAGLSDSRGNLIYEYIRLIGEVRPKFFVLENVANLTTAALSHRPIADRPGKHWSLKRYESPAIHDASALPMRPEEMAGSALRQLLRDIGQLGYFVNFGVLDAADFGAPQHRLRFVLIGSRDFPAPALPSPTHGIDRIPYSTVRDAIADLALNPGHHSEYTDPVKQFFALVPPGGNWRSLPPQLQRAAMGGSFESGGGKTGFFRRLAWDRPAPTITGRANRKGSALCHPSRDRPLSVAECARLQGFPDSWCFSGSMNAQYTQIGNAVPVALGAAIGRSLVGHSSWNRSLAVQMPSDRMMDVAIARLRAAGRNKRSTKAA